MSKKPTIQIKYPDASELAMQLTDAMIRRAPGKRVVETTSEDKTGTGEGSLLDHLDSVRTSTGVEMTLTLEPNSMDYALTQLIRPNLTEEEKTSIFGETENELKLETPDQEKQIEIGKISDAELRIILFDLIQKYKNALIDDPKRLIEDTIKEIDYEVSVIDLDETYNEERDYSYKTYALIGLILTKIEMLKITKIPSPQNTLVLLGLDLKDHLKRNEHDPEGAFLDAYQVAYPRRNVYPSTSTEEEVMVGDLTKFLYRHDPIRASKHNPSWDDVEAEARKIGQHKTDDIEPGLLNDLDDGSDGMVPAEEVIGHDE